MTVDVGRMDELMNDERISDGDGVLEDCVTRDK